MVAVATLSAGEVLSPSVFTSSRVRWCLCPTSEKFDVLVVPLDEWTQALQPSMLAAYEAAARHDAAAPAAGAAIGAGARAARVDDGGGGSEQGARAGARPGGMHNSRAACAFTVVQCGAAGAAARPGRCAHCLCYSTHASSCCYKKLS